jgi:hypothetical protein
MRLLEFLSESKPIATHKYYFSGIDRNTANDYNQRTKGNTLYPSPYGYYIIKYNVSGQPFFDKVRQLESIFGPPQIQKL